MKILNWNIDNGGRSNMLEKIVEVILSLEADVLVLPEFRKDRDEIKQLLHFKGYDSHIPFADYATGNQIAIFSKPQLNFRMVTSEVPSLLDGLVLVCENDELTVVGTFLPEKHTEKPSIHAFLKWIARDPLGLAKRPTVLVGDFNYGVQASFWNKGRTGSEYNFLQKWLQKNTQWRDCCCKPVAGEYPRTFCRNKHATAEVGQRWAKGSSRPDHFFVSQNVKFSRIRIASGRIADGISNHEPMVGDFSSLNAS